MRPICVVSANGEGMRVSIEEGREVLRGVAALLLAEALRQGISRAEIEATVEKIRAAEFKDSGSGPGPVVIEARGEG
jgi:hypothetical protein